MSKEHTTTNNPDHTRPGESQKFIRNNRYFTICIYGIVMILASAIIFKCILDIEKTVSGVRHVLGMLAPFILGALLAYVLNPMVGFLSRQLARFGRFLLRRWKKEVKNPILARLRNGLEFRPGQASNRILSIVITYVFVLGIVVLVLVFVIPELVRNTMDFVNYIPNLYENFLKLITNLQDHFPELDLVGLTQPLTDAIPNLIASLRTMVSSFIPAIYSIAASIANWMLNFLITIIVSIYMIYDKERLTHTLWRVLYALVPEKRIPEWHEVIDEGNHIFSSFVTGKFLDSIIIGILCFILMTILHLEYSPLISLIVGVTNMIPYFGPFIGAVPGLLILLFIKPLHALVFLIMVFILQQFDGLILGPKILGSSTGMKPLWIIFAITIGGYVAGVIGMFLGVPIIAFLSYLADRFLERRLKYKQIPDSRIHEEQNRR